MCLSIAIDRPDDVLSKGEHEGFQWMTVQNGRAYRCGYVRVPAGHPWHGKDWAEVDADVHGGITFGEADKPCSNPGPDDAWWVGFDCAHSGDAPDPELRGYMWHSYFIGETVRSQAYVEQHCRRLCEQAAEVAA